MASPISFQGLSTNLPTDQLVEAIIQQESAPLLRMQARQTLNTKRSQALQSIRTNLNSLASSLSSLNSSGFLARIVSSSDSSNTYVTASASGAAAGVYDVAVKQLATRATYTAPNALGSLTADLGGTAETSGDHIGEYHYAITDTDGTTKDIYLSSSSNTLAGLRDAINAAGAKVTATVVQTAGGGGTYKLTLSASNAGAGTASSTFSIVGNGDGSPGNPVDSLGLGSAGKTSLAAQNSIFKVNGLEVTRTSNTISDVAEGVTFTLKQADPTYDTSPHTTTLTVASDKAAITKAMQDAVDKYNAALKVLKDNSGQGGALANDSSLRGMFSQIRSLLTLKPENMPAGNYYQSASEIGLKTNRDGTLTLDSTAFQKALDTNPDAMTKVFGLWGNSSDARVSMTYAGSKVTTKAITVNLTYSGGNVTGTLQAAGGTVVPVSGTNGLVTGPAGTDFEGLTLSVTGSVSGGSLTVVRGAGQLVQDLVNTITAPASGNLAVTLQSIDYQNLTLKRQITDAQDRLARRRLILQTQFANLEATIGQMQSAGQSLGSLV